MLRLSVNHLCVAQRCLRNWHHLALGAKTCLTHVSFLTKGLLDALRGFQELHLFENLLGRKGNDTGLRFVETAAYGVGLARVGLSIGQHGDIVALKGVVHHVSKIAPENLLCRLLWRKDAVEVKSVLAEPILQRGIIQNVPLASLLALE